MDHDYIQALDIIASHSEAAVIDMLLNDFDVGSFEITEEDGRTALTVISEDGEFAIELLPAEVIIIAARMEGVTNV